MSNWPGATQPAQPTQPALPQTQATTQNVPPSRPTNLNYGLLGPYNTLATDLSFNQLGPYRFGGRQPFFYGGAGLPGGAQSFGFPTYNPFTPVYGGYGGYGGYRGMIGNILARPGAYMPRYGF